jgi:hypothetical protein
MPFRFWVPVGESREVVILDDKPDFFMYEHNMKNPATGRFDKYTGCVRDHDNCPVCETTGHEGYYALFLSVLDLTPYTTKNGDTIDFTRKLLVVKSGQQKKFIRHFDRHGTLRGAIFELNRDGAKDPQIGNDIEFVEDMEEDELSGYVRSWVDRDKKKHTEDCSQAFVYEDLFEEPDTDALAIIVGAEPSPGSRKANDHADFDEEEEDIPFEPDEKPARRGASKGKPKDAERPTRTSARRRKEEEEEEEYEDPEEEEEEEEEEEVKPARRGASRASARPAPAARGGASRATTRSRRS